MHAVIIGSKKNPSLNEKRECKRITEELLINEFNINTVGNEGFEKIANETSYKLDSDRSFIYNNNNLTSNKFCNNSNLEIFVKYNYLKEKLFLNKDIFILFPGDYDVINLFFDLTIQMENEEIEVKPIILYGFKFWNSLKSFFNFNNIYFPEQYVLEIVDSYEEFNLIFKKYIKSLNIAKILSSNEDIKNYKPIKDMNNNIFLNNNNKDLINDFFKNYNEEKTSSKEGVKVYLDDNDSNSSIEIIDYDSSDNC